MMTRMLLLALMLWTSAARLHAGGFIVVMPDQHGQPNQRVPRSSTFPLETRLTKVETAIVEQMATTSIEQVFYNPGDRQLEGFFLFPVPKDVVINKFTMFINGKETEAELLDAAKARQIYEQIVRRVEDPALLEYYQQGLFRVRIFPIMPKSEQRIRLTYSETLIKDNGTIEYAFPLNTQKYAAKPIEELSFKITVEGNEKIKNIYCPSHEVEIIRKGDKNATVGFEVKNARSDRDFQLYYNMDKSKVGMSLLTQHVAGEDGYFFLNLSPGLAASEEIVAKDIVFVFDKSGSMAGEKMDQGKKALQFCIENLNKGDRFEIIPFSTEASSLFGEVREYTDANKKQARTFIDELRPVGGTNIDEAFQMALASQKSQKDRPFFVIFLTDGKPTIGETDEEALLKKIRAQNKDNVRIFTFGIGNDLNTHLLDKLTEASRGYRSYVLPDEDIEIKVSDFFAKASSPVLTDLRIEFDKNVRISEVYPKQLPDLFRGGTLSLMGRFQGEGKCKITLVGKVNGKEQRFEYEVEMKKNRTEHKFIPDLWASRAVGYLLDQIRLHGESKELVEEVTRLAKKHGIITPYTSYLILEDERQLANNNQVRRDNLLLQPRANAPITEDRLVREELEMQRGSSNEKAKSGSGSVRASEQNKAFAQSSNAADTKKNSLEAWNGSGNANLAQDIANVQGRAFYLNNNQWIDANIQPLETKEGKNLKINRIKFGSDAYFKLLQQPENAELLALGRNVRFAQGNQVYDIYD